MEYELLIKAKQFLSIIETSTLKDEEITNLINSAQLELTRSGIDIEYNATTDENDNITAYDSLVTTAIMMYVKGNFGNTTINEKELALRTFNNLEQSLSLSDGYRKEDEDDG